MISRTFRTAFRMLAVIGFVILMLIGAMFFLAPRVHAQSTDLSDYKFVYRGDGGDHWYIEDKQPVRLKNGNLVFWAMTFEDEAIIQLSDEVNCKTRRARINGAIVNYMDKGVFRRKFVKATTIWFPKADEVSAAFVNWVCY